MVDERRCSNGRMGVIPVVCLCVPFARRSGVVVLGWSLFLGLLCRWMMKMWVNQKKTQIKMRGLKMKVGDDRN